MKFVGNSVPSIPTSLNPSAVTDLTDVQYTKDHDTACATRVTDYTNATATQTTVCETASVSAGTYLIEAGVVVIGSLNSGSTLSLGFGTTGGTSTYFSGLWCWYTALTATQHGGMCTALTQEQTAIPLNSTTPRPATFSGVCTFSVAGTVALKARLSATGLTVTVKNGAWVRVTPII